MSTPYQTIRLECDTAGVATLTLNRPEAMNAWNGRVAVEVDQALRACEADAREGVLSFLEKREPVWKLRPSVDLPEG